MTTQPSDPHGEPLAQILRNLADRGVAIPPSAHTPAPAAAPAPPRARRGTEPGSR